MKIGTAFEKRDWGSGRRTWRAVPALMKRYGRHTSGPSEYAIRLLSNRAAKVRQFGPAMMREGV